MAKNEFQAEVDTKDRVGFLGKTGSGKTFLAGRFINQLENIICIDTKKSLVLPGFQRTNNDRTALNGGKIVYRPKRGNLPDNFFERVRRRYEGNRKRNVVVYIDEAGHITKPNSIDPMLRYLIQAGREGGIGIWWAAQRPAGIHNVLLSESERLLVFRLPVKSDRQKVAGIWGEGAELAGGLEPTECLAFGFPEVEPIQTDEGVEAHLLRLEK